MFNNTYARTTVYNLPIFSETRNITILGDNKKTLAETATDFVFSFYRLMNNVVVFDAHGLFKNLAGREDKIFVTDSKEYMNTFLQHLIKYKAKSNVYLVILNAQELQQELILQLLKQENTFVKVVLFYNKPTKFLQDIVFNAQQVVFFKTVKFAFLKLSTKICLECGYAMPFLIKKMKGFVVCNMQDRTCKLYNANLGLKTHLIYNEITEVLEILLKKEAKNG